MKILIVNPAMRNVCGRSAMVKHLCTSLHESGHIVTLLTGLDSEKSTLADVPFPVLYTEMNPARKSLRSIAALWSGMRYAVREVQPDIVHTHHRYPAFFAGRLAIGRKVPHVTTVHSFVEGNMRLPIRVDMWVAVSAAVQNWVAQHYRMQPEDIRVIRNGIPLQERQQIRWQPPEPFSVLAAGRFAPEKGFDVLLRAWKRFAERAKVPVQLTIAGEGYEEESLRLLARACGGSVTILNGAGQMDALYRKAHLVVVSSRTEPLSYIVLEAGMRGIPLLVTQSGGPSELVAHERTGLVVPPANAQALTSALQTAVQSYSALTAYAERLREELTEHQSLAAMTNMYIQLYQYSIRHHETH